MAFRCLVFALAVALYSVVVPVYSQVNIPCSPSMITSFTPCLSFLTISTNNGITATPTTDCCNSLKSLTSGGTDCLCLIVTGSVPFQIPINQSLAISLPSACKMSGVPLQCKGWYIVKITVKSFQNCCNRTCYHCFKLLLIYNFI